MFLSSCSIQHGENVLHLARLSHNPNHVLLQISHGSVMVYSRLKNEFPHILTEWNARGQVTVVYKVETELYMWVFTCFLEKNILNYFYIFVITISYTARKCNKFVCCYSNYAASITYTLNIVIYSTHFCTLQFLSLLSTLDWALTSSVSLEGTLSTEPEFSECFHVRQWDLGNGGKWYEEIGKGRNSYVETDVFVCLFWPGIYTCVLSLTIIFLSLLSSEI